MNLENFLQFLMKFKKEGGLLVENSLVGKGETCCVIGNSGSVLSSEMGLLIDSCDFIIRVNTAKVEGYEKNVGSRTDLRIINKHPFIYLYDTEHRREVAKYFPEEDFEFLLKIENESIVDRHNIGLGETQLDLERKKNKITTLTKSFFTIDESIKPEMTTGMVSILIACCYFQDVYVHGFDFYSGKYQTHYFENSIDYDRTGVHGISEEKILFLNLLELGVIKKISDKNENLSKLNSYGKVR